MDLRRRLATLPPRSPERRRLMHETARLYGISEQTLYRVLRQQGKPRAVTRRMDRGVPRVLPAGDLTHYLELIAAVKLRTTNGKGRHLSTGEAIRLLEDYGIETPEGRVQAPKGVLKIATVNRYLQRWGWIGRPCVGSRLPCASKPNTATSCGSLISVPPISSSSRSPRGLIPRRVPQRSCSIVSSMTAVA